MSAVETRTLADLLALLSTLLDDTDSTSSSFFTTNDRKRALNNAYVALFMRAIELSDGEGPVVLKTSRDIVGEADEITLPGDYFRMVNVYYLDSEDTKFQWRKIAPTERVRFMRLVARNSKYKFYFLKEDNSATEDNRRKMVVVPTPSESVPGKLTIEYIPEPVPMDLDSDEPHFPYPLRELIAYEAMVRLVGKENMDLTSAEGLVYKDLTERFAYEMDRRSLQESRQLTGLSENDIY